MKKQTACFCLIFLLAFANFVESNEKISFYNSKNNETIQSKKSETIEDSDKNNSMDDDMEEDWEVYGDPRVKDDPDRLKLYKSFKNKFESGQFNFKLAMLELQTFELKRAGVNTNHTKLTPGDANSKSHFEKSAEKDSKADGKNEEKPGLADKLEITMEIGSVVSECVGAFNEKFIGDFCYKTKGSREPEICQCGYRYYQGNCWENCKEGFFLKREYV